jgi:cytochrome c oxidase cbb3-type subunit I/II
MIRPFRSEVERYGEYTKAGETVYDHPFLFGSKRTGPDLAREGVKTLPNYKPDSWHYNHMLNPQTLNAESIMPPYPWLITNKLDLTGIESKIEVMTTLGVPYPEGYAQDKAVSDLKAQAKQIADGLKAGGINADEETEIIALIAYLQRLGTDLYSDN